MKKLLLRVLLLALLLIPFSTTAEIRRLGISIFMPPLIVLEQPPDLIVLPETYVYVIPDIDQKIFFYGGWWWRQWEGSWYRSREYNSVWDIYADVPSFYSDVPLNWKYDYEESNWRGLRWNHELICYEDVQQNWSVWEEKRYWEKHTWGVQGLESTRMKRRTDEGGIIIASSSPASIVFVSPPQLIVVPKTNIYVIPGVAADIFFYSGWWWRPSEGHWYRSKSYNSGWVGYSDVPSFYREIPTNWRGEYRRKRWEGRQWKPELIPHQQVEGNWRRWEKINYWENERTWGVQNIKPVRRLKHQYIDVEPGNRSQQQSIGTRLKHQSIDAEPGNRSQQQSIGTRLKHQSIDARQEQAIDARQEQSIDARQEQTIDVHQQQLRR
ncbi:MAG: hypothetical protein HQK63_15400 [Desulfamplus sp.]|nr:hypothetical protein [Desulfamplus sp.]